MEYNIRFTEEPFCDVVGYGKKYIDVIDRYGKTICGISKKDIVDLNGKKIAEYLRKEAYESDGEKGEKIFFDGEYGEMRVDDDKLYLGEEFIGYLQRKYKNKMHSVLLGIACLLVLCLIVVVALIDIPVNNELIPTLVVTDNSGSWATEGEVVIFDADIYPGATGEYQFIIDNPHAEKLLYDFSLIHYYNGSEFHFPIDIGNGKTLAKWPIIYRLRVNNGILETEKWLTAEELNFEDLILLPKTKCLITLEWQWPFEGSDDELDTIIGNDNGTYSLVLRLTAESYS